MIKLKCFVIFLMFLPMIAYSAGYTEEGLVSRFRQASSNGSPDHLSFTLFGDWANIDGCTNSKWVISSNYTSVEAVKYMHAMVMAAYLSGQTIELYVEGCDSNGLKIVKNIWMPRR